MFRTPRRTRTADTVLLSCGHDWVDAAAARSRPAELLQACNSFAQPCDGPAHRAQSVVFVVAQASRIHQLLEIYHHPAAERGIGPVRLPLQGGAGGQHGVQVQPLGAVEAAPAVARKEPGDNSAVLQRYAALGATFTIAEKTPVTGDKAHPFFKKIADKYSVSVAPTWNFDKFLVDHRGDMRAVFPNDTEPLVQEVIAEIEEVLEDLPRGLEPGQELVDEDEYDYEEDGNSDSDDDDSDDEEEEDDDDNDEEDEKASV
ncbi:hypothetical protein ON010_g2951 [Phytophthora cinnamomi]|nr:hypothetical protein ON010_g2951 [Phytophthora cinnamomi]